MIVALLAFCGYALALLINAHKTNEQILNATRARLVANTIKQSEMIAELVDNLETKLHHISTSHAITTYLTNKNLGMSPRYGLNASLAAVQDYLEKELDIGKTGDQNTERLLYLDEYLGFQADTHVTLPQPTVTLNACQNGSLSIQKTIHAVLLTQPVSHKGVFSGCIVLIERLEAISKYIASVEGDAGIVSVLVDETSGEAVLGQSQNTQSLPWHSFLAMEPHRLLYPPPEAQKTLKKLNHVIKTPIRDFPYTLFTFFDRETVHGHVTSEAFLYGASAVPVFVVVVGIILFRMRERAEILEEKYTKTDKERFALLDRNISLSQEIARREAVEQELRHKSAQLEKLTEDLRVSIARSEEATLAKSQFLASMSHEIRTPMNGIIGMVDLALETKLDPEQLDYIEAIRSSAESLLTIINDILDFSKIEAGKMAFETVLFNLRPLIADIIRPLYLRAHEARINLIYCVDDEVPDCLVGDPTRLRQILLNLLSNAVKFTQKGHVNLHVSCKPLDVMRTTIVFTVEDTGIGIPKQMQERIFEAFSQADNSTTRRFGGTGLGLTISLKLTEMMGGKISLCSQEKQGSTFIVELPYTYEDPLSSIKPQPRHNPLPQEPMEPLRILLAEDMELNQRIIKTMLGKLGHEVVIAANGAEALETLTRESFDLLLMDMQMPVMGGLEATEIIRQNEKQAIGKSSLPIYALTADALPEERKRGIEAGLDGYMTKPLNKAELLTVLKAVAAKKGKASGPPHCDATTIR